MYNRNSLREIFHNKEKFYHNLAKDRGLDMFRHYGKLKFNKLSHKDIRELTIIDYIWKTGDKMYKISNDIYGDKKYWWVIGLFNKKPMDIMYSPGDIIHIPTPIEDVLYFLTRQRSGEND